MAGRLKGKVAIVTGASRGLGQHCAIGLGREGATVAIAARTEQERDPRLPGTIYETARLVEEAGGAAFPVVCNVADNESVQAMVKSVLDRYGRVDVLMTNAAIQTPGAISTMEIRHWELEFRVNVHGPFYCIRAVLPSMLEQKSGSIVTVSSISAHRGGSHYGATKRAIEAMSIGLAEELRDKGVAVNCLRPVGGIGTPGLLYPRDPGQDDYLELGELAPPDSYVEAVVLLAMQTPQTRTGAVWTDAEALRALADEATFERFRALNPPNWSASLAVAR